MKNEPYHKRDKKKFRKKAPSNYLIVCEGKKTEPNYFKGLKKKISEKYGDRVDVLIPSIEVKGLGMNTTSIVKYVDKVVNYSNKVYGHIWLVFDKDDFKDDQFDLAINSCDYNVAWSNPNFELWLLSHFKKVDKCISKKDVLKELEKEFNQNKLGKYEKNDKDIFEKTTGGGKIDVAIQNCKNMEKLHDERIQPSQQNPKTEVYKLIEELREYLK